MSTTILGNKNGVATELVLDEITGAAVTVTSDSLFIHKGTAFVAFSKDVVATGSTVQFSFKTPTTGIVRYRPAGITPSADKVDTQIFEGAAFTAETGTVINASNRNRSSLNASKIELRRNPTFTNNGTLLEGFSSWLPGSTGIGQTRAPTSGISGDEIEFKPNTVYRFVATNGSADSNTIASKFSWHEGDA